MAGEVLASDITSQLARKFASRIVKQTNRACVAAQVLPVVPHTTGKNISWDVEFADGTPRAATDGQDVSTYNSDTIVDAALSFANYDDAIKINGDAIDIAMAANNPEQLFDLVDHNLENMVARVAKNISPKFYNSTSGIIGMKADGTTTGALGTTGTYATINRGGGGHLGEFVGTLSGNGGVNRPLTLDMLQAHLDAIAVACGEYPDVMLWGYAVARKYAQLIQPERRWMQDVNIGGRQVRLDAGWAALEYNGIPIIRDVDCPANSIFCVNTKHTYIKQLTSKLDPFVAGAMRQLKGTPESQMGDRMIPLTMKIQPLAKTGDSEKLFGVLKLQLVCERPNSGGVLYDVE